MAYTPIKLAASLSGNTSGVLANISTGTIYLAGGNNITLSQNGNSVTFSGGNTSQFLTTAALSQNTSNYAGIGETVGTVGGTDLGLTVNTNGVSIEYAKWLTTAAESNHSHGNPTLFLTNLSGTTASASNGLTFSLSAAAGGGGAGSNTIGMSDLGNTTGTTGVVSATANAMYFAGGNNITLSQSLNGASGTITISALNMFSAGISTGGNSSGDTGVQSGQLVLAGGTNITLSGATAANGFGTVSISGPNPGAQAMQFWQNIGVNGTGIDAMAQTDVGYNQISLFQLDIGNNIFAGNMTVKTVLLDVSYNFAANSTIGSIPSYTISAFFGLYTISNTVSLHLLNSGSVSFGTAFGTVGSTTGNHYSLLHGKRWITMNSSVFSASLTMTQGLYYGAIMFRSSSNSRSLSMYGAMMGESGSRSGTFGLAATTLNYIGMVPYQGVYSTTTNAFPATIQSVEIKKQSHSNLFVPHIMFNNIQNIF